MNKKSKVMRSLFGIILLTLVLVTPLFAQESKKGFELNFSLVHPTKWSLQEYKYAVDPTLEVLYFTSLSEKFWVAGGLFAQAGKHNWEELTAYPFYDGQMWWPGRMYYSRQLEFFSLGIPVKIGMDCKSSVTNSLFVGFTAGNHLKINKADFLNSEFVADIDPNYNSMFWELNFGFRKILYSNGSIALSLSPVTGFRKNSPDKAIGNDNYFFYGLGISSKLGK